MIRIKYESRINEKNKFSIIYRIQTFQGASSGPLDLLRGAPVTDMDGSYVD